MKKDNKAVDEAEILKSFENQEWQAVDNLEEAKSRYKSYAELSVKKDKRINIRISSRDLTEIQAKALSEGIPYQTLISSVLHKYVEGSLIDG